jgi:uncharacterized membrane protein YgcG
MFTGTTSHSGALVSAIVVLTGAAILRGGAAAADSNDDQFLALLDQEGIPALNGVPSLIATAHKICRTLDAGMPADRLVDVMVNNAYGIDPTERSYAPGRLARTEARFITAAVEAYCPSDQGKIASIMANPAAGWHEPTHRGAAYTHNAVNSGSRYGDDRSDRRAHCAVLTSLLRAVPSGEITPDPPQIPPPPPPTAQVLTPPRPIATPTPPKRPPPPPQQLPPPPQQPPPPPQQAEPPAVGPSPGGAAGSGGAGGTGGGGNGSGGGGSAGGGGPAGPAPTVDMPPGFVRLAP